MVTRGQGEALNKREMPKAHFGYISLHWQEEALCAGSDTEAFYHDAWEKREDELQYLKRMCRNCPVIDSCLEYALETNEVYGIWGGMTPNERRLLRRNMARRAS